MKIFYFIFLFILPFYLFSQKKFEGIIVFENTTISPVDIGALKNAVKYYDTLFVKKHHLILKDGRTKNHNSFIYFNLKNKEKISFNDFVIAKFSVVNRNEKFDEMVSNMKSKIKIFYTNDDTLINGLVCKKILISKAPFNQEENMFVTDNIPIVHPHFPYLNAFPIKFQELFPGGFGYSSELIEIKKVKLSDSVFKLPNDYQEATWDEINAYIKQVVGSLDNN